MRPIVGALWFDTEAKEAVDFYLSLFEDSEIIFEQIYRGTPNGDVLSIDFRLENQAFSAFNGGPGYPLNTSTIVMVAKETAPEVEKLYNQLLDGGNVLIPLDSYPFSDKFGSVQDKYGLSWQIMLDKEKAKLHKIRLNLMFAGDQLGKAEDALRFYQNVFEESEIGVVSNYKDGEATNNQAKINYSELNLNLQQIILMDHGMDGKETFTQAFSFILYCSTQAEIDYYWEKLSYFRDEEACGWVKDPYGLYWQIIPLQLVKIMSSGTKEEQYRVTQAMLPMKKLDIGKLENAKYNLN